MSEGSNTEKKPDRTSRSGKILAGATVLLVIATGVLAVANVMLVCLTRCYLKETKAQREAAQRSIELTHKAFQFESSAKPYIKDVDTEWRLSEAKENTVVGTTAIKLANCGRSEARNVRLHIILTRGSLTDEKSRKLVEYIYPGQEPLYGMPTLKIDCTPEVILAIKEGKPLQIPKEKQEPINLRIELIYDEPTGGARTVPYELEYNYRLHKWVPAGFGAE